MATIKRKRERKGDKCKCALCSPSKITPHPKWGYDLDAVPKHPCLMCGKRIGNEAYREYPVWARFGQMFLIHTRCDTRKSKEKRD